MLTQEEKAILDFLIPQFKNGNPMVSLQQICKETKIPNYETDLALRHLSDEGYLSIKRYLSGCVVNKISHKGIHYSEYESAISTSSQTNIFNAPVSGAAIGNSGTTIINNGLTFQNAYELIKSQSVTSEDKVEAEKVIAYIEALAESEAPLKKGILSKFSDTLAKHSWLPDIVMKLLFQYITGQ